MFDGGKKLLVRGALWIQKGVRYSRDRHAIITKYLPLADYNNYAVDDKSSLQCSQPKQSF